MNKDNVYKYNVTSKFGTNLVWVKNPWTGGMYQVRKTDNGFQMKRYSDKNWKPVDNFVSVFFK